MAIDDNMIVEKNTDFADTFPPLKPVKLHCRHSVPCVAAAAAAARIL